MFLDARIDSKGSSSFHLDSKGLHSTQLLKKKSFIFEDLRLDGKENKNQNSRLNKRKANSQQKTTKFNQICSDDYYLVGERK